MKDINPVLCCVNGGFGIIKACLQFDWGPERRFAEILLNVTDFQIITQPASSS